MNKIERFEIVKTVSLDAWKTKKQWAKFKKGLEDGVNGVKEAIQEAYLVSSKDIDSDITEADLFGLHHEVDKDGNVRLNKFALQKAVADLESNDTLTDTQKTSAREHLLRHYAEIEEEPPESLSTGEMSILQAVMGGMKPEDIPVADGVDIDAIKAGDDDPLEVVVSVPEGKSKRGWYYTGESLKNIVDFVNGETLSGFLGHQKPENLDDEFLPPVTHWIGAKWDNGKAYFRGVIDKAAPDLKRWIRSKRVTQVSIFGAPKLKNVRGEIHVVGYKPMSIDWTPLHRAGMPSEVVAIGEMTTGSLDDLREKINAAVRIAYKENFDWCHAEAIYSDYVIIKTDEKDGSSGLYKVDYEIVGDVVVFGDELTEVERQTIYEPKEGGKAMTLQEMLAAVRSALAKGETDLTSVLGEIGYKENDVVEQFAGEMIAKQKKGVEFGVKLAKGLGFTEETTPEEALKVAGEMAEVWKALGFNENKPEDPAKVAGEMAESIKSKAKEAHKALVDETIKDKVAGEQAQVLVARLLDVEEGATAEVIAGEIDTLLADETLKNVLGKNFVDDPPARGGDSDTTTKNLVRKTASI